MTVDIIAEHRAAKAAILDAAVMEFAATLLLLVAVVGSGIMAERLSGGNTGLALLANSLATGGALIALIFAFGPQSGAHMNPIVTVAAALTRNISWHMVPAYLAAQVAGAIIGVWLAHLMFDLPVLQFSTHVRTGPGQWLGEVIATLGLLCIVWGCQAHREPVAAPAVGGYIMGAYWFTSSTSFANPAVTIARMLTDTFAGIRPMEAPGFMVAQAAGLLIALPLLRRMRGPAA